MPFRIIDAHQHLWDLNFLSLPWVSDVPELNRSFGQRDYQEYTKPKGDDGLDYDISQTVYMEVDVAESDIQNETDLILKVCRDETSTLVGMICASRPGTPGFEASLDFAKSNAEIKGFRRVLHTDSTPPGTCLKPGFQNSIRSLANQSLSFDLCMRREELADATELVASCSETQFVLDHCGNADARMTEKEFRFWENNIRLIARHDNVVCKVSGFVCTIQNANWNYESDIEPILQVVFESFGEDRVLFGGDWPVCTLSQLTFAQWVSALHRFAKNFGEQAADKLFQINAQRIYRL